ncbi:hypothetical protein BDD14_6315 [Edaphobacter modestus]|uniref:Uncharacterized protein n=1 Tax=Edaphobacter modestus TaxID=388466 RepID=A0A4Q7XZ55_9BACT|nr:hypothetical protein BDD14_6315 [Edaphobacter modestus]
MSQTSSSRNSFRLCCINLPGRSLSGYFSLSGCDRECVEELVYEANLIFDLRLTCEAMPSTDHTHHFKALDRSGRRLNRLKASGRTNDSLECAMAGFDDVVQVFAGSMQRPAIIGSSWTRPPSLWAL